MKSPITTAVLLGLTTCALTLIGLGTADARKVMNSRADVTVCDTLDSLIVMKEMPEGSALPSDCQVLEKGTWWGVVLIDLIEAPAQAEQIAIPLTSGGVLKVWAPASQLHSVYTPSDLNAEKKQEGNDPTAKLSASSKRILAIQRALTDFGYGQIKPTATYDPDTRTAIEKFQRDHRLPITGQISDRFVRELTVMTGRPLE